MWTNINWIEMIGYFGSLLVAISLMMNSIHRLRWINLLGSATFSLYGLLVNAYPVFFLNGFIALVDIYYIVQMEKKKDFFELFEIKMAESPFLRHFLKFYAGDIKKFFPDFESQESKNRWIIFTLRNMLPVGLFIAEPRSADTLEIKLDYVIPNYRDLQSAHFLYHRKREQFRQKNIKFLITHSRVQAHISYLKKIGFNKDFAAGDGWFSQKI